MRKRLAVLLSAVTLSAAVVAGCTQLQDWILPTPGVPGEWNALLREVRVFEQRIGFRETGNFKDVYAEKGEYSMCGYAPRFHLPYSYEDPGIRWGAALNEKDCAAAANGDDVYFARVEAVGEIGTALTSTMLEGKLDRFLYLVIHEDCHDQFDLPYGVEEALCNLLGYKGMAVFAEERYGVKAREDRAIRRYAETQSRLTRATVGYYQQLEQLYARHARNEIMVDALRRERARIFSDAERTLAWKRGAMSNVGLASDMTYSRHYPLLETVHETLGRDLSKTVAFFKQVDKVKPTRTAVMKRHRITDEKSARFVRAYEAAVVETVENVLRSHAGTSAPGWIK
jgi:hypothetical protein